MKLYFSPGACSLAVRITIHELNLPCEFEAVDLKTKQTASGVNYLTVNHKGSVPGLQIDADTFLTENAVIQQYLADTNKAYHLLPALGDFKRYRVLEWLNYVSTDVHKSFSPLFNGLVPENSKQEIFIPILKSKLAYLNRELEGKHYLMGDEFTLPDGYLFVTLRWLPAFKISLDEFPNVKKYFDTVKERPSVQRSMQEEGLKKR